MYVGTSEFLDNVLNHIKSPHDVKNFNVLCEKLLDFEK